MLVVEREAVCHFAAMAAAAAAAAAAVVVTATPAIKIQTALANG